MRALHRGLVGLAIAAAALATWVGDPRVRTAAPALGAGEISAPSVAQWIRDRAGGLRVVDLRSPSEFAGGRVPTAERMEPDALSAANFAGASRVVLYAADDSTAARAADRLRGGGLEALVLRGGYAAWVAEVLEPEIPAGAGEREPYRTAAALSRYFGGRPRLPSSPRRSWRGC
jgi:rhodanese-related sulfurtransferase